MINAHWESHIFTLPIVPEAFEWHLSSESGGRSYPAGGEAVMKGISEWMLNPRSSVILIAKKR